jgi:sn-glycerol 3-phosphate transport system permease protein
MVVVAAWNQIPVNFIFFLSGLQGIPQSVQEAAMHRQPVRRAPVLGR